MIFLLKYSRLSQKYVIALGQITGLLYVISDRVSSLEKLQYTLIDAKLAMMLYSLIALIYYLETIIIQLREYFHGRIKKRTLCYNILKESLENIGLLGYYGIMKETWSLNLANSIGSFISAGLSLCIK